MASFADDFAAELKREADKQVKRTVGIPEGLTEDQAVAHVIDAYRKETGIELPEADVRANVRAELGGRETT